MFAGCQSTGSDSTADRTVEVTNFPNTGALEALGCRRVSFEVTIEQRDRKPVSDIFELVPPAGSGKSFRLGDLDPEGVVAITMRVLSDDSRCSPYLQDAAWLFNQTLTPLGGPRYGVRYDAFDKEPEPDYGMKG